MEILIGFLVHIYNLFALEMTIYGFTFSFWDIFMFSLIAGVIFKFLGGILHED